MRINSIRFNRVLQIPPWPEAILIFGRQIGAEIFANVHTYFYYNQRIYLISHIFQAMYTGFAC